MHLSEQDQALWLDTLLSNSTLPPSEGIRRLLALPGKPAALVVFASAGEETPLEWHVSADMPAGVQAWLRAPAQVETLRRTFRDGVLSVHPQPPCADHRGAVFPLEQGAPVQGVAAFPVEYQGYRLGLLVVCTLHGEAAPSCDFLTRWQLLAAQIALPAFVQSLTAEKEHLQTRLSEVARLKDEFIAITSHELRTPLGLVLGHATFLREMLRGDAYQEHIEVIIQSALRIKEIIETTTQADNYQSGTARLRSRLVNLNTLVETLCEARQESARQAQIALQVDLPPGPVSVEADAEKVRIILNNLLENALTFTNAGGHIGVRLSAGEGYAQIAVQDDGIGIPEKDLAHIFERFYQVESHMTRHHGGMGLGLSVARGLAELHGGRIEVESREGQGSTFRLYLPLPEG